MNISPRHTLLLAVLSLLISVGAEATDSSTSQRIVGRWQNLDAQPSRVVRFLADGSWQLVYSGRTEVQTGRWKTEGETLVRSYDTGERRPSQIVKLEGTQLVLRTIMKNPATGQLVSQTDHYKRISDDSGPASAGNASATAEEIKRYEVWITGEVFEQNHQLMFRADKPVQGNSTGPVVLLGATKEAMNVLLPMYMKAAEKHTSLRLYGYLVPDPRVKDPSSPNVQFITWKAHLPSDPDDLPPDQKIQIGPNDKVQGYKVEAPGYKPQQQKP